MGADGQSSSRIEELRVSASGWHRVQLAVLGFIGLCGVLQRGAGSGLPHWLEVVAGLLALAAFGTACVATVLVALAAWPVRAAGPSPEDEELARTGRRLRIGITLTYVAVAVLALAASSTWWPTEDVNRQSPTSVQVTTRAGQICGELTSPSERGLLAVTTGGRVVELALSDVVSMTPVDTC